MTDVRGILRGESILVRVAAFLLMSGVFLLLVTLSKHDTVRTSAGETEDSSSVRPTKQGPPPQTPPRTAAPNSSTPAQKKSVK